MKHDAPTYACPYRMPLLNTKRESEKGDNSVKYVQNLAKAKPWMHSVCPIKRILSYFVHKVTNYIK